MGTLASGSIDLKSLKVAGEGATSYITAINNDGIKIHAANNVDLNYTQITSNGMEIFKTDGAESNPSAISIANFGEIVRIGKQDGTYIKMDYHSLQLIDKEQNSYFHISDLRKWENIEGNNIFVATLTENFILDNSQNRNRIRLQNPIYQIVEVTINDVITTEVHFSGYILYIDTSVAAEDKIQVTYKTLSDKTKAFTFGSRVTSSQIGIYSTVMGYNITANGPYSHAEGKDTTASGNTSHAEGNDTIASGNFSHAEGWGTTASGTSSHTEGYQTTANQFYSHAEGNDTVASGISSHAEGDNTIASGNTSHAEGQYTEASANNSHAEGYSTTASANHSHAEGWGTTAGANNSHAEGYNTTTSANNSHAEGNSTTASGYSSHAEGNSTTASGSNSHAEGDNTIASGISSHAEGDDTTASGIDSHASGRGTVAQGYCQTVIGHYNIPQSSSPVVDTDHAFIIGNGTDSNTLSNALTVDWKGRIECGDYSGIFKSIFNILYPIGSYYETSLPTTPTSGHSVDDDNLTDAEIANCGTSWFDPRVMWGGTWVLETPGMVHVSGASSGTYEVKSANTDTNNGDGTVGAKQGGSPDAIIPYHNHGHNISYTQNSSGTCSIASSGAHVHTLNLRNAGTTGSRATNNVTYGASGHDYQNSNPVVSSGAHTHTVPNHTHTGSMSGGVSYAGTSGNTTNANMQPYISVYRWHRTA